MLKTLNILIFFFFNAQYSKSKSGNRSWKVIVAGPFKPAWVPELEFSQLALNLNPFPHRQINRLQWVGT